MSGRVGEVNLGNTVVLVKPVLQLTIALTGIHGLSSLQYLVSLPIFAALLIVVFSQKAK